MARELLFLDIETVSQEAEYDNLNDRWKELWKKKSRWQAEDKEKYGDEEAAVNYKERAAILSEFGKIVCISMGFFNEPGKMRISSFTGNEPEILIKFAGLVDRSYADTDKKGFCGHNIKEFDIPYICRRMLVHNIDLPRSLNVHGKKPWELEHLVDTMNLWKFGDYKHFTSLDLLAAVMGIPSPKDDIDGSEVGKVFYEDADIDRIRKYCEKDVLTSAQVYLALQNKELIKEEDVTFV